MALPALTESYSAGTNVVTLGATAEEGGTRTTVYKIGGAKTLPFMDPDGEVGNKLLVAMDVLDAPPANWPEARVAHWSHLLVARAIENQAFVVGVNRVGSGGGLDYNGCSAIIDPMGIVLAEGRDTEQVIVADLEPECLEQTRKELPFLADARRDLFADLWP